MGVIGLSAKRGWASAAHLPALRAFPACEVVAVSASSLESARASAEQHGIAVACADAHELVVNEAVDLVIVAVKVPFHFGLVSAAVRAGKNVFCEWPLGNGLEEAQALAALAGEHDVRAFVGLQARSAPPVRFIRDIVASGEIGEVLSTTLVGSGDRWGATIAPETLYLLDRANGATMLTIPVGHTLDGVCFCLGELTELTATTAVRRHQVTRTDSGAAVAMTAEDQIAVTGRLENGAVMSVHYRGGNSPVSGLLWEITGSEGTLAVSAANGHLQYGRLEIRTARAGERELTPRPVPAEYETVDVTPGGPSYAVAHAYAYVLEDLLTGTSSAPTFADAVRRHRSLDAVERAADTGTRQFISPRSEGEAP